MQRVHLVTSLLDAEGFAGTLTAQLQCPGSLYLPVRLAIRLLCHAHMSNGLSLTAHVEGIVSFLFLGSACHGFCSLCWVVLTCQLLLVVWLVLAKLTGLTSCVSCNNGAGGDEKHMIFECAALTSWQQQHVDVFSAHGVSLRSPLLLSRAIWGFFDLRHGLSRLYARMTSFNWSKQSTCI